MCLLTAPGALRISYTTAELPSTASKACLTPSTTPWSKPSRTRSPASRVRLPDLPRGPRIRGHGLGHPFTTRCRRGHPSPQPVHRRRSQPPVLFCLGRRRQLAGKKAYQNNEPFDAFDACVNPENHQSTGTCAIQFTGLPFMGICPYF